MFEPQSPRSPPSPPPPPPPPPPLPQQKLNTDLEYPVHHSQASTLLGGFFEPGSPNERPRRNKNVLEPPGEIDGPAGLSLNYAQSSLNLIFQQRIHGKQFPDLEQRRWIQY